MYDNLLFYIITAIVFLILIASIIFTYFFSRAAVVRRKLQKTVEKKISSFQNGESAKVVGTIKFIGKPLIAPLSGRQCVYYHVLVEENTGKDNWKTLIEEEIAGNVIIKDGNHYAVVETGMVKSYLVDDKKYKSGFLNDATETLTEYLLKHNCKSIGFFGMNKTIRYKEGILEEGEIIAVAGKGTWKRRSEIKLEIPIERILVIGPDGQIPVYFSDDPETVKLSEP